MVAKGFDTFHHRNCAVCHGVLLGSSGEVPDLRTGAARHLELV